MSGSSPLKARSIVALETPARSASARNDARQEEISARAGEPIPTTAEAAYKDNAIRYMGAIIRDLRFPVEAGLLAAGCQSLNSRTRYYELILSAATDCAFLETGSAHIGARQINMLDHPLRHILQNLTCYIPGVRALQRARAATGAMNDAAVMTEWTSYIERDVTAAGKAISGSTFLEVGPGHSIGVAINLIKAGAKRVYALDVEKYADLFALDPKLRERFHYVIVREQADWPIEPQSVDVVY